MAADEVYFAFNKDAGVFVPKPPKLDRRPSDASSTSSHHSQSRQKNQSEPPSPTSQQPPLHNSTNTWQVEAKSWGDRSGRGGNAGGWSEFLEQQKMQNDGFTMNSRGCGAQPRRAYDNSTRRNSNPVDQRRRRRDSSPNTPIPVLRSNPNGCVDEHLTPELLNSDDPTLAEFREINIIPSAADILEPLSQQASADDNRPPSSKKTKSGTARKWRDQPSADLNGSPPFDDNSKGYNNLPPSDYRNRGPIPGLPINKVDKPYDSIEHYLHTQFTLMRADCMIPLREAVKSYHRSLLEDPPTFIDPSRSQTQRAFRLYEHTRLQGVRLSKAGILHRFSFRLPHGQRARWTQSKRLISGSCVLLSSDGFEKDIVVATVSNREIELLTMKSKFDLLIDLKLESTGKEGVEGVGFGKGITSGVTGKTYIMLEGTNGYFEAYRHILKGLQTVNPRLLPFASSIVGVNREPGPPRYVDARPCYDFSVILEGSASQPPIRPSFGPPIRSPPSIRLDIDVLAEKWEPFPTSLDASQLNALKTILTKRLAIVQGPPGTGKTYVGLQAVKLILHNFDHRLMGPIICICQTNHALDQFLEGILKFEDSIVRVGGRSKSEEIKLKTMYQLRQNMDRPQKAQGQFYNYRRREDLERQIRGLLEELHEEPCVSVGFLRAGKRMNERQIDSLERGRPEKKTAPKQENKREGAKNETDWLPEDEDSDDDEWIFTSAVKPQDKFGNDSRPGAQKPSIRGSGRLNGPAERTPPAAPPPKLNRVEEWIKEALTTKPFFSCAGGVLDEFKEDLLEANKGLVFVNDADEEIDEEQLREILEEVQEFREDQSRALLEKFIGLGDAYWADPASGGGLNMGGEGRAGGGSFDPGPWSGMQGRGGSANGGGNGRQQSGLVKGAGNGRQQQGGKTLSPSVQARLRMEEETRERKIVNYGRYLHDEETEDGEEGDDSLKTVQEKDISKWKKVDDVHAWPLEVKLEMHRRWIRERDDEIEKKILKIVEEYQQVTADIKRANVSNDAKLCRANRIVGMTSTAAAKYHDLLEEIGPRIIIFEEAAEMLEAHIITALTKSVEQLVLIGDHQQLRPIPSVDALARHHNLNISLFERMVKNNLPFTRLSEQRRMRTLIRHLIDPIYHNPPLRDHPDVDKYPSVDGMSENVFFLTHDEIEENFAESKHNDYEAEMATKLAKYLIMQGYAADWITILTMYSGQRKRISDLLRKERVISDDLKHIKVSSVDGYQGEENYIIILSLVRSNMMNSIGFLNVANRVCVALSRAKHGMYIIGNTELLRSKDQLWETIIGNIEEYAPNSIGNALPLQCQNHPRVHTRVRFPVDFIDVEEGGCSQPCQIPLNCGHPCHFKCHNFSHDKYVTCRRPCERMLPCGHPCSLLCGKGCGKCEEPRRVTVPGCQHIVEVSCSVVSKGPDNFKCPKCQYQKR